MIDCIQHPEFLGTALQHCFCTRFGGVSSGVFESLNCGYGSDDDPIMVAENRRRVANHFGHPVEKLCTASQVHGTSVLSVQKVWNWDQAPIADALVTNLKGIILGVLTADCAPVLLADRKNHVVGVVHAGWRGALGGVIASGIEAMLTLGACRSSISAVIGPCIGPDSYEVGDDFPQLFIKDDNEFITKEVKIEELTSSNELRKEGRQMNHCVASYARSCKNGVCSIFSLKVKEFNASNLKSKATIEVRNKQTVQIRAKHNLKVSDGDMNYINIWKKENGIR